MFPLTEATGKGVVLIFAVYSDFLFCKFNDNSFKIFQLFRVIFKIFGFVCVCPFSSSVEMLFQVIFNVITSHIWLIL